MIKLLILMALGKRIKNPNRIFYLVKSYLVFYMLALPVTNFAVSFQWANPLPVAETFNIETNEPSYEMLSLRLQNLNGTNFNVFKVSSESDLSNDMSPYHNGVYLLNMISSDH